MYSTLHHPLHCVVSCKIASLDMRLVYGFFSRLAFAASGLLWCKVRVLWWLAVMGEPTCSSLLLHRWP
jgi:hypothetical protein